MLFFCFSLTTKHKQSRVLSLPHWISSFLLALISARLLFSRMLARLRHKDSSDDFDMQVIGTFLSFASRGDRVGLNQMLREGTSPNVQDYDKRTALHLAASEGHAPIVELLLHYNANVNLEDRWKKTVSIYLGFKSSIDFEFFNT